MKKNRNMKLNIRCEGLFSKPSEDGNLEIMFNLPSTRFNNHSEDDLNEAIEGSVKKVLLQIKNIEASRSNLKFIKVLINNHTL